MPLDNIVTADGDNVNGIQPAERDIIREYAKRIGFWESGAKAIEEAYDSGGGVPLGGYSAAFTAYYNAGREGRQEAAEVDGRSNKPHNKVKGSKSSITTRKSDWPATDVEWCIPGQKSPIAYSSKAVSDLIVCLRISTLQPP